MAEEVKDLIDVDQKRRIIIKKPFVWGKFKVDVPDFVCEDFEIIDNTMTIYATGNREPICDGSSLAPDVVWDFNTIVSSIGHDCGYQHLEKVAEAWGWEVKKVRKLFDDAFGCDLLARAKAQGKWRVRMTGKVISHIYHWCVRAFGGFYHSAKSKLIIAIALTMLCMGCGGCVIPDVFEPSLEEVEYVVSNVIVKVEAELKDKDDKPSNKDDVDYKLLQWKFGGFHGENAQWNSGVVIGNLAINKSGMSYSWIQGNCEMLGAAGHTNADCIAALFCEVGGKWVGGKFEWISTSRTTRSWHNIGGYNGWSWDTFNAASRYAFVIVSKDGRSRSNVIVAK